MNKVFTNIYMGANNIGIEHGCERIANSFEDINLENYVEQEVNFQGNKTGYKHRDNVLKTLQNIAKECERVYLENNSLLTIGGDHSLAAASVAVANEHIENLGLIWIDAHADINDQHITNSGHIHGMPVSFLMGNGEEEFVNLIERDKMVNPNNIVYFATRDIEPLEQAVLEKYNIKEISYKQIIDNGFEKALEEAVEYLKARVTNLHISYDIDSGSPLELPGVSTPVVGGLTKSQSLILVEKLLENFCVRTADIVEYNPQNDIDNQTLMHFKKVYDLIDNNLQNK